MTHNLLTVEDRAFISVFSAWLRASMKFSILNTPVENTDPVLLRRALPAHLRCQYPPDTFLTIGELVKVCEQRASNRMIYESWLNNVLDNIYEASRALSADDADRVLSFFKNSHGIQNLEDLAVEATDALTEAWSELYGDLDQEDEYEYSEE